RIGFRPAAVAARVRSTAPAIEPWSVRPIAGISSSAARATSGPIRQAPSRIEYSLWTCRWTYGWPLGTDAHPSARRRRSQRRSVDLELHAEAGPRRQDELLEDALVVRVRRIPAKRV